MKKIYLLFPVFAFIVFVSGCDQQPISRVVPSKEVSKLPISDEVTNSSTVVVTSTTPTSTNIPTIIKTNIKKSMEFDADKQYTAILHTSAGDIEIALNHGETPNTVKNFVDLSRRDFYNKTVFHRVIKGFMIQGGDPQGNGMGGPGYKFADESFSGGYTKGTVAMANSGPNTNGSQFFIMHADYPLPKNYVIFGHVVKGLDVVDKIAENPVGYSPSGEKSTPLAVTTVTSVEVSEK